MYPGTLPSVDEHELLQTTLTKISEEFHFLAMMKCSAHCAKDTLPEPAKRLSKDSALLRDRLPSYLDNLCDRVTISVKAVEEMVHAVPMALRALPLFEAIKREQARVKERQQEVEAVIAETKQAIVARQLAA